MPPMPGELMPGELMPGDPAAGDPAAGPVTCIVVLSDTHLAEPGRPGRRDLPEAAWSWIRQADVLLHAGDVLDAATLDHLSRDVPLHAVLGNNDSSLVGVLPTTRVVELAGVRIGMVHDSGPRAGRSARLRRRFPDCAVVVFGHSHEPADELGDDGQRLFNPGSPTQRRAQPRHTLGVLEVADGAVVSHRIVALD
jgi:putative phosphoesterase